MTGIVLVLLPAACKSASPARTEIPSANTTREGGRIAPLPTRMVDGERPDNVQEPYRGIWISADELACLKTTGVAWEALKEAAERPLDPPELRDQDDNTDVFVLARALVYARTGEPRYREGVIEALRAVTFERSEEGGRVLALARNLPGYVIAADLINLPAVDPDLDRAFRDRLREMRTKSLDGRTLVEIHEVRPNNWGTHAGAARLAVAVYLGEEQEIARVAQIFKGWTGDRSAYAGFKFRELWWQADPRQPVAVNPVGALKDGHLIDGALPEEMRRGGPFQWPPGETGYPWEALQGAVVQANILSRLGYPAWEWEDRAVLRAVRFLYSIGWPAEGDDEWQVWLINAVYGTDFPAVTPARPGKNMGWTDWTHGERRCYAGGP